MVNKNNDAKYLCGKDVGIFFYPMIRVLNSMEKYTKNNDRS